MRSFVIAILFTLLFQAVVLPDVLRVPGEYPTIQAAMDAAQNGDTVLVAPGTYVEQIDFKGKSIHLKSSDGAEHTTIWAEGPDPHVPHESVVKFTSQEGPDAILEGFTISNGWALGQQGGGVCCINSSPTILNNIITLNIATSCSGGGLYSMKGSPHIEGNTFIMNGATYGGGGIIATYDSPVIINNIFTENLAELGGAIHLRYTDALVSNNQIFNNQGREGLGIYCYGDNAIIEKNVIVNNKYYLGTYGGGIMVYHHTDLDSHKNTYPVIRNNIIAYNEVRADGGGIWCETDRHPKIINNVVFGNTVTGAIGDGYGGGLYCMKCDDLLLLNNVFWNNSAVHGQDLFVDEKCTVSIDYSVQKEGLIWSYVDPDSTLDWGDHMISVPPLFADAENLDFHLTRISPCINRGTTTEAPMDDIDGDLRPHMGTVDVGVDEFTDFLPLEADTFSVSQRAGTFVEGIGFTLTVDYFKAGQWYCMLGTLSGSVPGFSLPGVPLPLPLNWDSFTDFCISHLNDSTFFNFMNILDGSGKGMAELHIGAGQIPVGWIGKTMHFAYFLDFQTPFVSNPIAIAIDP